MIRKTAVSMFAAMACLGFVVEAHAHAIAWPRGISHQMGVGSCTKGPCMRRTSFAPSVPHRHLAPGKCEGLGAAGYTYGRTFDCRPAR